MRRRGDEGRPGECATAAAVCLSEWLGVGTTRDEQRRWVSVEWKAGLRKEEHEVGVGAELGEYDDRREVGWA